MFQTTVHYVHSRMARFSSAFPVKPDSQHFPLGIDPRMKGSMLWMLNVLSECDLHTFLFISHHRQQPSSATSGDLGSPPQAAYSLGLKTQLRYCYCGEQWTAERTCWQRSGMSTNPLWHFQYNFPPSFRVYIYLFILDVWFPICVGIFWLAEK